MQPVKFLLVRHGQTAFNKSGVITGQEDIDLNETGISQAQALSKSIPGDVELIFTSSLHRATKTANIITQHHDFHDDKFKQDVRFSELDWGNCQGQKAMDERKLRRQSITYTPPNGESSQQAATRIFEAFNDVLAHCRQEHISKVLLVSHAGVMRILLSALLEMKEYRDIFEHHIENCRLYDFEISELSIPKFWEIDE